MVQIIERPESFGTRIARGLGGGLGTGFSKGLEEAQKLAGNKAKRSEKVLDRLYSQANPYLKLYGENYLHDEEKRNKLIQDAHEKYGDEDIHPQQMLSLAMQDDDRVRLDAKEAQADTRVAMQDYSNPMNFINKFVQRGKIPAPAESLTKTASEERDKQFLEKTQRYPKSIAGLLKGGLTKPEEGTELSTPKTLGSMLAGATKPFEDIMSMGRSGLTGEPGVGTQLSEALQKDLTPEQKEKAELYEDVGLMAPMEKLAKPAALAGAGLGAILGRSKFKPFWRAAKKIAKREGIKVEKAAENLTKAAEKEGVNLEKILAGEKAEARKLNEVAQDIGTPGRKDATAMRMSRLAPESKLYKKGEQQKILQSQLKAHPRYAAEIAANAEQRAERLNKTLGPQALATREAKMATAQAELPAAKAAYQSAIGRVRALENELVKLPEAMQGKMEPLLEAAKQELKDSEFFLAQILNNAKSGESRSGLSQMRDAARNKMDKIADLVAEGKEVKHTKMDYSPDMIKEGKRISKKKPVPGQTHDDFYTRVHDEYSGEYAKRLRKLQDEIKAEPKGFSGLHQNIMRQKESKELQKMIDSAQAENTIHRHKLKLREMDQRKLARERLGKSEKITASTPSKKVGEDILKGNVKSEEVSKKAADEALKKFPKADKKIAKEETEFKKGLEEFSKLDTRTTRKNSRVKLREFQRKVNNLLEKVPLLGKTDFGKNIIIGLAHALVGEVLTEIGYPKMGIASGFAALAGPKGVEGYVVRGAVQGAFRFGSKAVKHWYKVNEVEKAHRSDDRRRLTELREKYSSAIMKEGAKEAKQSRR